MCPLRSSLPQTVSRFTIDRFEDHGWAVLEDERGATFRVPGNWLPAKAREGDVLDGNHVHTAEGTVLRFRVDSAATEERLATAQRLRSELPRGPKGNVSL
jgi:hypothetical protein